MLRWGSVRVTPSECADLHKKLVFYPERYKTQHYELNPEGVTHFYHDLVGTIDFNGKCSGEGTWRDYKFSIYAKFIDYVVTDYYSGIVFGSTNS